MEYFVTYDITVIPVAPVNPATQYAVGADGGKLVGPIIGSIIEGRDHVEDMVSVHFKADLSKYWDGKSLPILTQHASC